MDSLRAEFDNQSRASEQVENQVAQQIQEMELIRNKVYQLEQNQLKMKQDYEAEIRMLRHELEMRGGPQVQSHLGGPPQHGGPAQAPLHWAMDKVVFLVESWPTKVKVAQVLLLLLNSLLHNSILYSHLHRQQDSLKGPLNPQCLSWVPGPDLEWICATATASNKLARAG